MQRLDESQGAERCLRSGLDDHSISAHQSWGHLPCGNRAGKIPRRNQGRDSQRLAEGVTKNALPLRRDLIRELPGALPTEVAKDIDGAFHFPLGFGQGLPFLAGHVLGQFVEAGVKSLGGFEQVLATTRSGAALQAFCADCATAHAAATSSGPEAWCWQTTSLVLAGLILANVFFDLQSTHLPSM